MENLTSIQLKEEKQKFDLSKEEIEKYQQIGIELRVKEFTALVYKDGLEAVTKEVKEVIEKWLTRLFKLTTLEAQNLTKEYLVKNYGIRTTL